MKHLPNMETFVERLKINNLANFLVNDTLLLEFSRLGEMRNFAHCAKIRSRVVRVHV